MNERTNRLLPRGQPRYVRCYDNGGATSDRYTVVFTGNYRGKTGDACWHLGTSAWPFHPQGIGQHGESERPIDTNRSGFAPAMGRRCHLGWRIPFRRLPPDCRKLVLQDYRALWDLR